jgi:predicted phosphodiesterase
MTLAIISDVHANIEALQSVLADIDEQRADAVVCLGDAIGYGPNPEEALCILRERGVVLLAGNHESALVRVKERRRFNPSALAALDKTGSLLSAESVEFIKTLPLSIAAYGILFVHGCPPDSAHTYLFQLSDKALAARFAEYDQDLCFVGHTHELELITLVSELEAPMRSAEQRLTRDSLLPGSRVLDPLRRYIINVGSVGQPRDGDPRAKYALYSPDSRELEVRCVAYDFKTTSAKIIAAGLPEQYARRLWGRTPTA